MRAILLQQRHLRSKKDLRTRPDSQQAIEKWLKAYLIKQGEEIRKIHDLTALVIECEKYDPYFEHLESLVEGITDFAVEFRYPGENATHEEVKDAIDKTGKIRDFIMPKIEES